MNRDRPLFRDPVELGEYIMPHCDPQDSFLLKKPSVTDFERVNLLFLSAGLSLELRTCCWRFLLSCSYGSR
jgi:hypothetical protein